MIVCLCHRVSDRDIRRAVAEGTRNFEVLQDETRAASACGACHDCAREVFNEAVSTHLALPVQMMEPLAQTRRVIQLASVAA
ncbi:(2Fe-2S)-binding protein [Roseateles sp. DB2]|uniref:(2Fe-2S)-binding protein n=1 Tax=Roseateles sp. DB2 TaxID=3453717 RepID=UPI003EED04E1